MRFVSTARVFPWRLLPFPQGINACIATGNEMILRKLIWNIFLRAKHCDTICPLILLILLLTRNIEAQIPWKEVQACRKTEGQLTLRCPTGHRIMIFAANYGNSSGYNCSAHLTPDDHWVMHEEPHSPTYSRSPVLPPSAALSLLPSNVRCDHDMTSVIKDLCSGREVCLVEIEEAIFRTPCDGNESLNVKYACIPGKGTQVMSVCNRNLTSQEGHILSPGYPEYYPGPSECSWRISAGIGKNIVIMLNDLSLRPKSAKDNTCLDYVVIYEEDRQVIKTCHSYPFNLQVASNTARIALVSTSHGWSSKGLWIFYRAVGCSRPYLPELVHLSSQNYTSAVLTCQEGMVFRAFDEPLAEMTLSCLDGKEWHRSVPACVNTTEWRKGALDDGLVRSRANIPIDMLNGANLTQIVIPSAVVGALLLILIAALGIVLTLRRHRRRGIYHTHEIEHLHVKEGPYIVRKAPRAQLDSATDLEGGGYPLTDLRH